MKKNKKYFGSVVLLLLILAGYSGWKLLGPTINEPDEKYFYVHTGAGYDEVKKNLLEKKIISGAFWFDQVAKWLDYDKMVKPGRYRITNGMSITGLVRMLRSGRQAPVNLVITKLRTKEDLAKKLAANFEPDSITAIRFLNNNDSLEKYGLDSNTVMAAVIPNTYTLKWNNTVGSVFKKLFNEQQSFWTKERRSLASSLGLSPTEVYTLASIVEEETNDQEDKGKIASVYMNRMKTGMKLAADPTVKFAMKDFGLKRIYFKHLSFPSPFNTYQVKGLPPGPICTPSIKTIDAVLHAPSTDYLFFVASPDFSGRSNFASSYEEHQKYARAYQVALDSLMKSRGNKE
jgi:UPF0755 protein